MSNGSCRADTVKAKTGVGRDVGNASGLCEGVRNVGEGGLGSWLKDKSSLSFLPWGLGIHQSIVLLSIFGNMRAI